MTRLHASAASIPVRAAVAFTTAVATATGLFFLAACAVTPKPRPAPRPGKRLRPAVEDTVQVKFGRLLAELQVKAKDEKAVDLGALLKMHVSNVPASCRVKGNFQVVPVPLKDFPGERKTPGVLVLVVPRNHEQCKQGPKPAACSVSVIPAGAKGPARLAVQEVETGAAGADTVKAEWDAVPRGMALLSLVFDKTDPRCDEPGRGSKTDKVKELIRYAGGKFVPLQSFDLKASDSTESWSRESTAAVDWFEVGKPAKDVLVVTETTENTMHGKTQTNVSVTLYCFRNKGMTLKECTDAEKKVLSKDPNLKKALDSAKSMGEGDGKDGEDENPDDLGK